MSASIAFVDSRIADYQTLINGLPKGTDVVVLDGNRDGLQQMADALAGRSGLDAIHILSHGSSGSLQLGTTTLTSANLNNSAELLAQIGQSLIAEGDLLIYGCNVGAGETGQGFVESIARITQADVASSDDLTGNAAFGGDWLLETATGTIETPVLQAPGYDGALAFSASMVKDIYPGSTGQQSRVMAVFNDILYFNGMDPTSYQEPWKYDGTADPSLVYDLNPGAAHSQPNNFTTFNNAVYFRAIGSDSVIGLWKYDGTNPPTRVPGAQPSANSYTGKFTEFNGELYFYGTSDDNLTSGALFKSNGTTTTYVGRTNASSVSAIDHLTVFNNKLYFQASDGATSGAELYVYDGSSISRVADINAGASGSAPSYLTVFNNALYFQANDGSGARLWKYDGTNPPTKVATIHAGADPSTPMWMTVFNGALYYQANDGTNGTELWKYDGASAQLMVANINTGAANSAPQYLTVFNNELYFQATTATHGIELWKFDGSNASRVTDINPNAGNSGITWLTEYKGGLYFWGADATNGQELWRYYQANATPTVTGTPTDVTVTENAASNFDLSAVTVADTDGNPLTVTLTAEALAGGTGTFAASSSGSVIVGGSGTATLTLAGTAADINTWLDTVSNIQYTSPGGLGNTSGDNAVRFTLKAHDGTVDSTVAEGNIDITDVNPTLDNATFSVAENSANNTVVGTVVTSVDTNGINFAITGGNTGSVFAINPLGQIVVDNSSQLNYEGTSSYTLTVTVDDEDAGTVADATATITVNLTDVNEAPVNTKPGVQTTNEDTALVFSSGNGNALSVVDQDAGTTLTTVVSVASGKGTLAVNAGGGGTITGDGSNSVQIVGTVAQVQNALGSVTYTPTANANGAGYATLTIQSTDNGTGTLSDTDTVTVNVTPIADTPSVTNASTTPSTQTTSGLVLSPNAADGAEVTHFQITGITNGSLFKANGSTQINDNDFITVAEGTAGLKFTPSGAGNGNFTAQASTSNAAGGLGGSTVNATIAVGAAVASPTVNEDNDSGAIAITKGGSETHYKITSITGGTLYSDSGYTNAINNGDFIALSGGGGNATTTNVYFRPIANANSTTGGNGSFVVQASTSNADGDLTGNQITSTVTLTPVADTPSITNATTSEDVQSTSGLVISRNAADGAETTHFKISSITGGTLYKSDGTTPINNDSFITFAEGNAGLKFTPTANSSSNGSFNVEASTNGTTVAGSAATATVNVNAVADTPTVASPTINEDADSGAIAITRNAADGTEVTHYKVTGISGGTLYSDSGYTTAISNGDFIASGGATTNVYFRPTANSNVAGSFTVQGSTSNAAGGLGGSTATSTITITPIADTPSVTNANTTPGTQTTSGLVLTKNAADGAEVTHYKITSITNGNLFKSDGTTPITNGMFITVAEGNPGLKFTPTGGNGSFTAQASKSAGDGGLGGSTVTATISVNTPPTITSNGAGATASINTAENSTTVTTVVATDPDMSQTVTYSITGGADSAKFAIDSSTGVLTFVSAPDFETPTDSDFNNAYLVTVTANDANGGTDPQALTVSVTDLADGGTVGASGSENKTINNPTGNVAVNNTGSGTVTVTGVDDGATVTTTGSGNTTLSNPDGGVTVANTGTGLVSIGGLLGDKTVTTTGSGNTTVNDPAGGVTLHNTGTGTLSTTGVNTGATVTTTGTGNVGITNPDGNVTVNNTGTGVTTVTGTTNGNTVTTQGTGPIVVNSILTTGSGITVVAANNTDLTVDNDGTGSINVTGVTNGSTINSTGNGTGTTTVANPTGNLTLNNTGSNTVTVTGFDTNKTLSTPGTGPVTVDNPDGNLFLNNTGSGAITVSGINSGNSVTTSGSGPVNVSAPDGNVNVFNNGTGLATVSGATNGSTINCTGSGPQTINLSNLTTGQSVTIDNDGTGLVNLTNVPCGVTVYFTGTGPTTVSSFSGNTGDGPVVLENLSTSLVTVANGATGMNGSTVSTAGSSPIKFDTDVPTGETMTVNIANNTNVTFDNDGAGTVNVAGAPNATTLTSSSSGPMTVTNPTGNLTLVNTGTGSMTVTGTAAGGATVTTASSTNTSVTNPGGNLTVANTGSGTVSVTGLNNGATLSATGTGATSIASPDADASITVSNTGTGLVSVSGVANSKTVTTQGTGQIAISSALGTGESITVNATANSDVQITNTGAGQVNVSSNLALDTNDSMNCTLTGNNTTILNLTGTVDLGSAPLTLSLASGYTPAVGDQITLISNDGVDAVTGIFAGLAQGATVIIGGRPFAISYTGGSGNDVVLTALANQAPVITSNSGGATAAINVAENSTAVTTVTATDADSGQTVSFSLTGGTDQAKFSINSTTGALTFASAPDFESPTDSDTNNTYVVEVTTSDGNGGSDVQAITVTVTDVGEGGGGTGTGTNTGTGTGTGTTTTKTTTTDPTTGTTTTETTTKGGDGSETKVTETVKPTGETVNEVVTKVTTDTGTKETTLTETTSSTGQKVTEEAVKTTSSMTQTDGSKVDKVETVTTSSAGTQVTQVETKTVTTAGAEVDKFIVEVKPTTTTSTTTTENAVVALYYGDSIKTAAATQANIPVGVTLTSTGARTPTTNTQAVANLLGLIDATAGTAETNKSNMLSGGKTFLAELAKATDKEVLIVNKLKLEDTPSTTVIGSTKPIEIVGAANTVPTDSGVQAKPVEAIVIDATGLAQNTQINLQNIELAVIVGNNLILRGGEGANRVFTGAGSQDIRLGADNDELHAGDGNDIVGSEGGDDKIYGDAGNDTVYGGEGNDLLDGGTGFNTATYVEAVSAVTVSLLKLGKAQDTKGAGTDTLKSIQGLRGSEFNDTLIGSSANNTIEGGAGNDVMDGGAGKLDMVSYEHAASGVTINLAQGAQITGAAGTDSIKGFEGVLGSAFADTLTGSKAKGYIDGGAGNDTLITGFGIDTLIGGLGSDTIDAGSGGGRDMIRYNSTAEGGDTILNFRTGKDKIEFVGSAFGGHATGKLAKAEFISGAGATAQTAAQHFVFDTTTGNLYFDADGSGTTAQVLIATIGHATLTASDIVFI